MFFEVNGNCVFENVGGINLFILFMFYDFLNEENIIFIFDCMFDDLMEGDLGFLLLEYVKDFWEDDMVFVIVWVVYCCNWYEVDFWRCVLLFYWNF